MRSLTLLTLLLVSLLAAGCNDNNSTPTVPEQPIQLTATFDGTLTRNEEQIHRFDATRSGQVTAQLVAVEPADSEPLALALGTWNGLACTLVIARTDATSGTTLLGATSAAGPLCVRVAAPGTASGTIGYQLKVDYY